MATPATPYSPPTNHLMPTVWQEFSLFWGYKNWLLTHDNCWLSLVRRSALHSQCPLYLLVLNKLTPFWNALCLEILLQPALGLPQQVWSVCRTYIKLTLKMHSNILCVCVFNHVHLFATPGTVARQAPLSMKFSRQEYWSGWAFPPPGNLPDPGIEPESLVSPTSQANSLPLCHLGLMPLVGST